MTASDQTWRDLHAAVIAFMPRAYMRFEPDRDECIVRVTEKLVRIGERQGHFEFKPNYIKAAARNMMTDKMRCRGTITTREFELLDNHSRCDDYSDLHLWNLLQYAEPRDLVAARVIGRLIVGDTMAVADKEIRGPEWSNLANTTRRVQSVYLAWENS